MFVVAQATSVNVWSIVPSVLWFALAIAALLLLRKELASLLRNVSWRLRTGAAVKLFSLELAQSYVAPNVGAAPHETALEHYADGDGRRWNQREQYYLPNRNVHVVHRVAPSTHEGMLYDIQLYVIPHRDAVLSNVAKVEYYFGRHWGNQVFVSLDRARGFPISTSAFGPFMCTAELFFTDGERVFINRYVDFEMGGIGART